MDTALALKIKLSEKRVNSFEEAKPYLDKSELFQKLLTGFEETSLTLLHRLIELAEIPYAQEFGQVREWRDKLAELTFCEEGFSLSGKKNDLLACYNAMITTVLIKLNYPNLDQVSKGIDWILKHQNTRRNQPTTWKGKGIQKYGGCMKATPCFIGVVKSMVALTAFKEKEAHTRKPLSDKLESGMEYILEHKAYKRKSTGEPITKDITKLTYPFDYKTNVIEILRLADDNKLVNDRRLKEAKELVSEKQKKDGFWRVNSAYRPKHWIDFDQPKEKAEWASFEIRRILG